MFNEGNKAAQYRHESKEQDCRLSYRKNDVCHN